MLFKRTALTLVGLLALAAALLAPPPARAGTEHIPNGLSDFTGALLPPPGLYWLNYLLYVDRNKLMDNDGNEADGIDFKAKAFVEAFRLVWMTPYKLFGATYGAQVILPFYKSDLKIKINGVGTVEDSSSSGLGDITINPMILSWHFSPRVHAVAALDIVAPTGPYDSDRGASTILNKNLWTFEPLFVFSYWIKDGFDASIKLMYNFQTEDKDTNRRPGQEFKSDWGLSYALGKEDLRAGVAGFFMLQTTDDRQDGETVSDSKSRLAAVGPAVKWWPGMGRISVTAKYLKEFWGKNYPEGQSFWINTIFAF